MLFADATLLYHPLDRFRAREPGFLTLGWNFRQWRISGRMEWDGITVLPMYESVKMQLDWQPGIINIQYRFYYYFDPDNWTMRLGLDADGLNFVNIGLNAELSRGTVMLFDAGIKLTLSLSNIWISFNLMFRDLPRDWFDGPSSAGDFESGLRFVYKSG